MPSLINVLLKIKLSQHWSVLYTCCFFNWVAIPGWVEHPLTDPACFHRRWALVKYPWQCPWIAKEIEEALPKYEAALAWRTSQSWGWVCKMESYNVDASLNWQCCIAKSAMCLNWISLKRRSILLLELYSFASIWQHVQEQTKSCPMSCFNSAKRVLTSPTNEFNLDIVNNSLEGISCKASHDKLSRGDRWYLFPSFCERSATVTASVGTHKWDFRRNIWGENAKYNFCKCDWIRIDWAPSVSVVEDSWWARWGAFLHCRIDNWSASCLLTSDPLLLFVPWPGSDPSVSNNKLGGMSKSSANPHSISDKLRDMIVFGTYDMIGWVVRLTQSTQLRLISR